MKIPLGVACIVAAGLTFTAPAVDAHHASNLDYDIDNIGTVEGVVDDVFWANPHIHFYLTVATEDGSTEIWDMEGPNLVSLRRQGITRDMIQVGDKIRITGRLGRDGAKRIWAQGIVKADGTVVMGEDE